MKIEPADTADVYAVARDMRERDFEEFSALLPFDDRDRLALALAERYGGRPDTLCGFWRDRPVCIGGLVMQRPNVVSLLFFATEEFPHVALPLTRFIVRELFPRYLDVGVHRIEAISLAKYESVHAWLGTLGLEPETGPLRGYGKRGESFMQFSKVADVRSPGA